MEHKYWLHRISHRMEISYPLLERGYISIGFSGLLKNGRFLKSMISQLDDDGKWETFKKEYELACGKLNRTRYNLWRFLCKFKENDYVLIPSWGTFHIYEIIGKPMFAGQAIEEYLIDWNNNKVISGGEDNRYLVDNNNEIIDLGFVIPVRLVEKNIPRSDYAENDLLSRMKIRQTNADISDLADSIEKSIKRYKEKNPINIYAETVRNLSESLKSIIDEKVDHNQFERLIKCYFEKIGADDVYIPSRKDGIGEADGDIVARFDSLKLVVYVQAKHHTGETGEKGVDQISKYTEQKQQETTDLDYNSISWVISSAEEFSEKAQALAVENNIKLINGSEFRKMLIDAGMAKIANGAVKKQP